MPVIRWGEMLVALKRILSSFPLTSPSPIVKLFYSRRTYPFFKGHFLLK
jgi:hypothetical protein